MNYTIRIIIGLGKLTVTIRPAGNQVLVTHTLPEDAIDKDYVVSQYLYNNLNTYYQSYEDALGAVVELMGKGYGTILLRCVEELRGHNPELVRDIDSDPVSNTEASLFKGDAYYLGHAYLNALVREYARSLV